MRHILLSLLILLTSCSIGEAKQRITIRTYDGIGKTYPLDVISFPTAKSLAMAFFETDDLDKVINHNLNGVPTEETIKQFIKRIEKRKAWGWTRRYENIETGQVAKAEIYVWSDRTASFLRLLEFFSHELGHLEEEHIPCEFSNEMRAYSYGYVVTIAYALADTEYNSKPRINRQPR